LGLLSGYPLSVSMNFSRHPLVYSLAPMPVRRSAVVASIDRRRFLKVAGAAGAGAAAPAVAAPAVAQSSPEIQWRMPVSWPKTLDTLYGGAEQFCKYVSEATDGKFQIQPMVGDEKIPALEVTEAVANGTVEACHTAPYYMWAKDPAFAFGCAVPFGLNGRMQNSWWLEGGGETLLNAFYAKYNIYGLLAGNTMAQMGGWFRKEINTIDDLKGIKMRIGGFAGIVISKLGVAPQQMAGNDIYQALEKGTVDAAEWVGPHDDEKLGLHKVAKFYYYPGWWEGGAMIHVQVNKEKWDALPKSYQAILKAAAAQAHNSMIARYDALNPVALKKILAAGTQLRPYSEAILDACFKAANDVYAEIGAKNEDFRKLWESTKAFRSDQYLWQQLADNTYDNYMLIQQRKKTL
jgi:TRAP-type mannitol/chloroaromatic compound transport system substrate-binding protein